MIASPYTIYIWLMIFMGLKLSVEWWALLHLKETVREREYQQLLLPDAKIMEDEPHIVNLVQMDKLDPNLKATH